MKSEIEVAIRNLKNSAGGCYHLLGFGGNYNSEKKEKARKIILW